MQKMNFNSGEIENQLDTKTIVDDDLLLEHNQISSDPEDDQRMGRTIQEKETSMSAKPKLFIILTVIAVLAGVGTGFGSFRLSAKSNSNSEVVAPSDANSIKNGDVFGSENEIFDTNAIGYIEEGGIDGEGSHKLLRPGGVSQTVYLTSSVTDLDAYVGMEVEIWGETFKGQKAGWFMDVGKVKIIEVNGESPSEE